MFHKHAGKLCAGFQVHVEDAAYYDHEAFRPWRLSRSRSRRCGVCDPTIRCAGFPLRVRARAPRHRLISGGDLLRRWVDDPAATPPTWTRWAGADEAAWRSERQAALLY